MWSPARGKFCKELLVVTVVSKAWVEVSSIRIKWKVFVWQAFKREGAGKTRRRGDNFLLFLPFERLPRRRMVLINLIVSKLLSPNHLPKLLLSLSRFHVVAYDWRLMLFFVVGGSMLWITCAIGEIDWHLVVKTIKPHELKFISSSC